MQIRIATGTLTVLIVYMVGYALWLLLGAPSGEWAPLPANLLIVPPPLLAALVTWQVARAPNIPTARTWRWLSYGLLLFGLGSLIYTVYDALGQSPFPSLADLGYLAALPCFAVGVLALRRERLGPLHTLSFLTDAALVTLVLGDLLWRTSIRDTLAEYAEPSPAMWVSLAYPAADLLLAAATVTLALWRPLGIRRRVIALLALGLLLYLGSDVVYYHAVARDLYAPGALIDLGWPLGALLLAWTAYRSTQPVAVRQASVQRQSGEAWKRLIPHYAVLGVFVIYLVTHLRTPLDRPQQMILWLVVGLFALRQFLVLTDNQRLQVSLTHRADHDPLTGVRNRRDLETVLQRHIDEARSRNAVVSVLFVDLDRMKEINDTFGHPVGDRLLRAVADRLSAHLPPGGMIVRFGGDEFVATLPGHAAQEAAAVAETLLDAVREPFQIGPELLHLSASIGVALAPGDADHAGAAIAQADAAMYRAKQAGKGTWRFADERLNGLHMPQAKMEVLLRGALERGELSMHFQPLMDLRTEQVRSFEALVRWTSPELGMVSPAVFIPVAEAREMMGRLGRWVLRESIQAMCAWQAALPGVGVAVNVSATRFAHSDFVADVCAALSEHGGHPQLLTLEVTESAVLADGDLARAKLQELRALGVRVALDDFGTGYSSLGQLRSLPVDILKIDRIFIQDSQTDKAFIQAIISMGHSLGLKVVAEGIEDARTVARLQGLGCDLGQGFYFARPQPAEQAVAAMVRVQCGVSLLLEPLAQRQIGLDQH
ncbi:putative bifunctional diguanylate cyclase/phosphodiesterase [Deinococcus frigens]|uniref:putative bifunctional diguanylate cyclase/phosphodiesterase n=1 Tax=Deinococcus frigens TaxID=249403 RepID=UPI000691B1E1|nr:bifunctional diguanylate cyclase/phosphodiesterase [Deinococcus frigens]